MSFQREPRSTRRRRKKEHRTKWLHPKWIPNRALTAPMVRSSFYDYLLLQRGPFGGMKRSRVRTRPGGGTMSAFVDPQPRSSRAGRHRARLYGNSVGCGFER